MCFLSVNNVTVRTKHLECESGESLNMLFLYKIIIIIIKKGRQFKAERE